MFLAFQLMFLAFQLRLINGSQPPLPTGETLLE